MAAAISKFNDVSDFLSRHVEATQHQRAQEEAEIEEFNEGEYKYLARVITAPREDKFETGYIFRIDPTGKKWPVRLKAGETCLIQVCHPNGHSLQEKPVTAEMTPNQVRLRPAYLWDKYFEFRVGGCSDLAKTEVGKSLLKPLITEVKEHEIASNFPPQGVKKITVIITFRYSDTTAHAELTTAERLGRGRVLEYLVKFPTATRHVNLLDIIDKKRSSTETSTQGDYLQIRERIVSKFDSDQLIAFRGLSKIPEGVHFVPGGPGGGKTLWCLWVAALAHAAHPAAKFLYMADVNKTVDHTANKMVKLYQELGMKKRVIRMHGWPAEVRKAVQKEGEIKVASNVDSQEYGISSKLAKLDIADDSQSTEATKEDYDKPNFSMAFHEQYLKFTRGKQFKDQDRAMTLHEAALEHYLAHKDQYKIIGGALDRGWRTVKKNQDGKHMVNLALVNNLFQLYKDAIATADLIATTPVAAQRHFARIFQPKLIFFDECGHSRELSTLISVAYYQPTAWIFMGDHRQSRPFVKDEKGPYALQLKMSLMERASLNGAIQHQLLINHRARGDLHILPSQLFYDNQMRTAFEVKNDMFCDSVLHLQTFLGGLRGDRNRHIMSSRLLVSFSQVHEDSDGDGRCHNPQNGKWVMKRIQELLKDRKFVQVDGLTPGTIMVLCPYTEACNKYRAKLLPEQRKRVEVLSFETVLGQEADIVFIDMVKDKTTSFLDNPNRLCVAFTRARQAEVILMHPGLGGNDKYGAAWGHEVRHLAEIWRHCSENDLILRNPDSS